MKKIILMVIFALVTGCAPRQYTRTLRSPDGEYFEDYKRDGRGGETWTIKERSRYGYGMYGEHYAAPPVIILPGLSEGESAMERIPGGITIVHPADLSSGSDPEVTETRRDVVQLARAVKNVARAVKKLQTKKKKEGE